MSISTLFDSSREEERPSAEEWDYEFVGDLTNGIDLSATAHGVGARSLTQGDNIRFLRGQLLKDLGFVNLGDVILGRPRASFEYFQADGSSFLILITDLRFYLWNSGSSDWDYVSDGTDTTLTAGADSPDTTITVDSISGFSDGDPIGIRLDSGAQHRTTIDGAPAGSDIDLDDAMPGPATSGADVVHAQVLAGSVDIQPTITTWAATDLMYFTNGVDAPKKFNGTTVSDISGLPGGIKARVIDIHINHLILLWTEEGGQSFPQRERWTEVGTDSNWNTSVNFVDHYDSEDHIVSAERLGVYLIIYKERSIIRQEHVGSIDQTWNWITVISGEGTIAADTIINLGEEHIFWGNSNIYRYRGGFDLEALGDPVFDAIFNTSSGDLSPDNKPRIISLYVEEFDEAWFFYPTAGSTFPRKHARLNLRNNAWTFRTFDFDVCGFGFFSGDVGIVWNTAPGTWAGASGQWVGSAIQAGAPTVLILDGTNFRVREYDFFSSDDAGTAIPYTVITKDWFVPNRELRFDRYDLRIKGTNILVEISVDGGENYVSLGTISPGTVFSRQRLYRQLVGRSMRFRFSGDEVFGLEEIGFTHKRETIQP